MLWNFFALRMFADASVCADVITPSRMNVSLLTNVGCHLNNNQEVKSPTIPLGHQAKH